MIKTVKARNARSKRALDKRQPKIVENVKQALFVPSANANAFVTNALVDLHALKKPDAKRFQRKNEVRPFEDASSLEFFSEKNDTSLMVVGSHNKKRPNNLTFVRFFNYQVYDMIELLISEAKFSKEFKCPAFNIGMKPMFVFNGELFDSHPIYMHIKSLFLDFFKGDDPSLLDPAGLQHVISLSVPDQEGLPKVYFRVFLLDTLKSNTPKVPRVELQEIGPRFTFNVGRRQAPNPEMEKLAMKRGKVEPKTKKNVERDFMGDKVGRIHMQKQDFGQLQTRKMKGLKRKFDQEEKDSDLSDQEDLLGEEEEEE